LNILVLQIKYREVGIYLKLNLFSIINSYWLFNVNISDFNMKLSLTKYIISNRFFLKIPALLMNFILEIYIYYFYLSGKTIV
jgi:hypothetical protein